MRDTRSHIDGETEKMSAFNTFLHEYSCYAPPTMTNHINKRSRWYIEESNYLSDPLV